MVSVLPGSALAEGTSTVVSAVTAAVSRLDFSLGLTTFFFLVTDASALFWIPLTDLAPSGSPFGCSIVGTVALGSAGCFFLVMIFLGSCAAGAASPTPAVPGTVLGTPFNLVAAGFAFG